jgi:AAA15 family ATPase/GTPase
VDRLFVKSGEFGDSLLETMPEKMQQLIRDLPEGKAITIAIPYGPQLHVEKEEGAKLRLRAMQSEHVTGEGKRVILPFSEESDGTQRLTHLLPALHSVVNDKHKVIVIDEIDRSLHPLLAKGFVRAFLQACAPKQSQLIFTTHELAFMDLDLLRRDEIWFAAKKLPEGSTELYSLTDYKVRTDLKVDKAYLQGRFEAIPPIETELPGWVQQIMQELKSSSGSTNAEGAA